MRVLVTGATGCFGRNLVETLKKKSKVLHVTATGRNQSIGYDLQQQGISFVPCELSDGQAIKKLVKDHDLVVHSAALASPWGSYQNFYRANVLATQNILEAVQDSNHKRFIYLSTPSLYFNGTSGINVSETAQLAEQAANHYVSTKKQAEDLVLKADIPHCLVFRPRAIFGPYDRALLPRILRVAQKGFFPLIDGGEALVDVTYVQNFVDLVQQSLESEFTARGVYNMTNGEPVTMGELLSLVFSNLGIQPKLLPVSLKSMKRSAAVVEGLYKVWPLSRMEPPLTKHTASLLGLSQTLDVSKVKRDLAYNPSYSVAEGVERSIKFMKEQRSRYA